MRFGIVFSTFVLMASVASAEFASGQRPQQSMRPGPPSTSRPAPPPPVPPPAPPRPIVAPTTSAPQAPAPFAPTLQPQARSPFDATPRTYAPRYDGRSRRRYGPPYYSSASGIGGLVTGSEGAAAPDEIAPPREFPGPLTSPVFGTPQVVAASRGPDTYYVIPGCYAGNRPPNPQRLPKGCDLAKLRTTPVR